MSSARFNLAKKLIKQERYDEAREVLQTINHPMALDLIDEIDKKITAKLQEQMLSGVQKQRKTKTSSTVTAVFIVGMCVLFTLLCGPSLFSAGHTTPTITLTPSQTLTPSVTLTPSETLTPSATLPPTATSTSTDTATPTQTLSATELAQTRLIGDTATKEQVLASQTAASENLAATRTQISDDRTATADAMSATKSFLGSHKSIATGELVSYADKHIGEDVVVRGRVFNIIDDQTFQIWLIGTSDAIYVTSNSSLDKIYKEDVVIVYGTVAGYVEGTNSFGGTIKQPKLIDAVIVKQ